MQGQRRTENRRAWALMTQHTGWVSASPLPQGSRCARTSPSCHIQRHFVVSLGAGSGALGKQSRRTQTHTFSRTCTTAHYPHISSVRTLWLKVKRSLCHVFVCTHSISFDMSLLNVPFSRFPQVLSSPTCLASQTSATSTSFGGSRQNPCASARWNGMSGRMANPTQNTGYELNFYSYLNEEHTPINLPDSFPCRDDATIISVAEDPEVPYSGTSSSNKQTAASRVPTMLGSFGPSPWKQRPELVDSRASI